MSKGRYEIIYQYSNKRYYIHWVGFAWQLKSVGSRKGYETLEDAKETLDLILKNGGKEWIIVYKVKVA